MNRTLIAVTAAFIVGLGAGHFGTPFIGKAHAASGPIALQKGKEVLERCDFTKTIVMLMDVGYACVPK